MMMKEMKMKVRHILFQHVSLMCVGLADSSASDEEDEMDEIEEDMDDMDDDRGSYDGFDGKLTVPWYFRYQ